ncbi:hypothetical protein [Verrucosispora sp. NA02020]|uniref:hypothetical protein n=1 Tax=Verrucosispora sp. NA02020 TaxID=2742132 RepID=UPI0015911095|nr:hypothetical protein [Verrucosispora sp. NA02020]QKW16715.1 hypothetical protein HUT12_30890 [Verrucosispora sp. NA02020]
MTTVWPEADQSLERSYRRLLLAYPRRHRRRHGTELTTTLLEMAAPGQRRPRAGDAVHLIASGLRLRFRLPTGRPLLAVVAVLTALTMGAFGAAAGSWLGAQTFADLPDNAEMNRLTAHATGTSDDSLQSRVATPWQTDTAGSTTIVLQPRPTPWRADSPGTVTLSASTWNPDQARQRFAADGWSVSSLTPLNGKHLSAENDGTFTETSVRGARFSAQSNGLIIHVSGYTTDGSVVSVQAAPARTAAFLPMIVGGTGVGLLVGWLVAASVAYRMVAAPPGRRWSAAGLWSAALLVLALPAGALYGNVMRVFRDGDADSFPVMTVHSAFTPGDYYPFGPPWLISGLTVAGALVAVAALLVARPGEQPPQQPALAG